MVLLYIELDLVELDRIVRYDSECPDSFSYYWFVVSCFDIVAAYNATKC